jgi:transposase
MRDMTHNTDLLIASEKERWLRLHFEGGLSMVELARRSGFARSTLYLWKMAYEKDGLEGLKEKSRAHHSHPKQTKGATVSLIRQIRSEDDTPGAERIALRLKKRYGVAMEWRTIHKVLVREGLVRKRRRIWKKEKWVAPPSFPGEIVQIDVAYARKYKGQWLYQFTAIDGYSRWRYLKIFECQGNHEAVEFLRNLISTAPFKIQGIQTDNASIFTNYYTGYKKSADPTKPRLHVFDKVCAELGIVHYLINPGKPAQNGKVERSHRTDRELFWRKLTATSLPVIQKQLTTYVRWYNEEREHLGIEGLTTVEKLKKCPI